MLPSFVEAIARFRERSVDDKTGLIYSCNNDVWDPPGIRRQELPALPRFGNDKAIPESLIPAESHLHSSAILLYLVVLETPSKEFAIKRMNSYPKPKQPGWLP
jgi:hypothetical protein